MKEEITVRGGLLQKINIPLFSLAGIVFHIISFYSISRVAMMPVGSILIPFFIFFPPILAVAATIFSIVQLALGYRKISAIIGLVINVLWLIISLFLLYVINLLLTGI